MREIVNVEEDNYEDVVLKSNIPVVLDFWAEWCGPCKMMNPVLDEIVEEFGEKIKVVKINVDKAPNLATKHNIRGIPTIKILNNGQEKATKVGAMTIGEMTLFVEENIK